MKRQENGAKMKADLKRFSRFGEPIKWGLLATTKPELSKFLESFGLELVEHLNPGEIDDFFMRKEDGKIAGPKSKFVHMVIARVP
jgi:hypothetical protein